MASFVSKDERKVTSRIARRRASFEWRIENFSHLSTEGYRRITSPLFSCFSIEWEMHLYPNGNTPGKDGGVGIFMSKLAPESEVRADYKISVQDECGAGPYMKVFEHICEPSPKFWGWPCFFDLKKLLGEKRAELLPNDVLTVYCEVNCMDDVINGEVEHVPQLSACKKNCSAAATIPMAIEILVKDVEDLLKEKKYCDVTLQVGEEEFSAHKLLLGARSTVFAAMFEHGMKESPSNVVTITDIEPAVMTDLLRYIYSGDVSEMSAEKAAELYVAADKYDLSELKSQCVYSLQKNLTVENACDVAILADTHNDGMLIDCLKVFVRKSTTLLSTEKWKRLAEENPRLAYEIILDLTLELSFKE